MVVATPGVACSTTAYEVDISAGRVCTAGVIKNSLDTATACVACTVKAVAFSTCAACGMATGTGTGGDNAAVGTVIDPIWMWSVWPKEPWSQSILPVWALGRTHARVLLETMQQEKGQQAQGPPLSVD